MHDDPTLPLGELQKAAAEMPALRDTWGPFRLLARVGSGGFGEVYRAWDPNLEREVALKLLLPGAVGGEEEYKSMLREARAMASVLHPNIVHVYGIDRHDGRVGFWTDFVKGKTLSALLGLQGPFGYREAALIGIDVSRALSAVHRAGLLHRDIKAENVMREEGGRILLMDFGLSAGERSLGGQIAGTPNYMAPELFDGSAATVCTDIYALGVLLYYLVIAEYPARLSGLTVDEAKLALARRTPLMDLRSDLPESFLRAVRTAMELDPARRFASAGQLADSLAESLGTGTMTPSTPFAGGPAYSAVTPYTEVASPAPPPPRPAPPPPPPAAVPPTWMNLFGALPWALGLSRRKKWALFCVLVFGGQRLWHTVTTSDHKAEPAAASVSAPAAKDSDDDEDDDTKAAAQLLQKAYKGGNVTEAVKAFLQALEQDPNSAKAQAGLGSAYFKQYRSTHDPKLLEMAKTATSRAMDLDKDEKIPEAHATMASIDAAQGQFVDAMLQAKKAISMAPANPAAYGALADVYQAQGKKSDAIAAAKKAMTLAPDQAEWPLQLGSYYSDAGSVKEATAQWQKSIELDSDNGEAYLKLGRANLALDKLTDAHDDFEKVIAMQPGAASYNALASTLILQGKYGDAVKASKKATELSPLDYASWGVLGRAQQNNGDHDEAMKSYAKAIDLAEGERLSTPDDPILLAQLAIYYAAAGNSDLSVQRLKRAVAVAPGNSDIAYRAGLAYATMGRPGEATGFIIRALAVGADRTEILHSPELAGLRNNVAVQALLSKDRISVWPGAPKSPDIQPPVAPVAPTAPRPN